MALMTKLTSYNDKTYCNKLPFQNKFKEKCYLEIISPARVSWMYLVRCAIIITGAFERVF